MRSKREALIKQLADSNLQLITFMERFLSIYHYSLDLFLNADHTAQSYPDTHIHITEPS